MINTDRENIAQARKLVSEVTAQSCFIYNQLCATESEKLAYDVFDRQLRIASKLADIEKKIKS